MASGRSRSAIDGATDSRGRLRPGAGPVRDRARPWPRRCDAALHGREAGRSRLRCPRAPPSRSPRLRAGLPSRARRRPRREEPGRSRARRARPQGGAAWRNRCCRECWRSPPCASSTRSAAGCRTARCRPVLPPATALPGEPWVQSQELSQRRRVSGRARPYERRDARRLAAIDLGLQCPPARKPVLACHGELCGRERRRGTRSAQRGEAVPGERLEELVRRMFGEIEGHGRGWVRPLTRPWAVRPTAILVGCMVDFHWDRSVGTARNCSVAPRRQRWRSNSLRQTPHARNCGGNAVDGAGVVS